MVREHMTWLRWLWTCSKCGGRVKNVLACFESRVVKAGIVGCKPARDLCDELTCFFRICSTLNGEVLGDQGYAGKI
jgi:hypothetical protein